MIKQKIKLVIICPSSLPVPAVDGGAIETLIQNFIDQNEESKLLEIIVISKFSKCAYETSRLYNSCRFIWVKCLRIDSVLNLPFMLHNFTKRILGKTRIPVSIDNVKIKAIIKRLTYDFVLIEGNGVQMHYLKELVPKNKMLFHIHSFFHCVNNSTNNYLMRVPGRIIAVSSFIRNSLIDNLAVDGKEIIVLKNCVGKQFFEQSAFTNSGVLIDRSKINFVFTGRIVKEKGIIELIKALFKLKDMPIWHLHIIGSFGSSFGSNHKLDEDNLAREEEIKKELSAISGFYTIHGYIENKLIPDLYKNFDLAFSPSICNDAAPLVIGEYTCSSIPVVASDQGGIPEYLNPNCGIIVKYDENFVDNLSDTICRFLMNRKLLAIMSDNCMQQKITFSSKEYYVNLLNILESN